CSLTTITHSLLIFYLAYSTCFSLSFSNSFLPVTSSPSSCCPFCLLISFSSPILVSPRFISFQQTRRFVTAAPSPDPVPRFDGLTHLKCVNLIDYLCIC
ncbi:hypothetical protein C8J56DRAFT_273092, partial [Mycena floridula]